MPRCRLERVQRLKESGRLRVRQQTWIISFEYVPWSSIVDLKIEIKQVMKAPLVKAVQRRNVGNKRRIMIISSFCFISILNKDHVQCTRRYNVLPVRAGQGRGSLEGDDEEEEGVPLQKLEV